MMAFSGQITAGFCLVSAIFSPEVRIGVSASGSTTVIEYNGGKVKSQAIEARGWPEGETLAGRPHTLTVMPGSGVPSKVRCPLFSIRSRAQGAVDPRARKTLSGTGQRGKAEEVFLLNRGAARNFGVSDAQEPAGGFEGCWMFLLRRWDGAASAHVGQFGKREAILL